MKKNKKFLPFFKKKWIALIAFYELCNNAAYSQASVSTLSGDVTNPNVSSTKYGKSRYVIPSP